MKYIKTFESGETRSRDNLIDAIQFGNKKEFDKELKNFFIDDSTLTFYNINFKNDDGGWTPLTAAIYYNRKDMLKELLEFGADINYYDSAGQTPLMLAAARCSPGSLEMMSILIEYGADWNIVNKWSKTDFFDYTNEDVKKIIIEDYPEKYQEYLMKKDSEKYNI